MKIAIPVIVLVIVLGLGGLTALRFGIGKNPPVDGPDIDISVTPASATVPTVKSGVSGLVASPQDQTTAQITLTITAPIDGVKVKSKNLLVRGRTQAGAEVFVNDAETTADRAGNFSVTMILDEGENYFIVFANNDQGNIAEKEFTVTYDPGT